jgi:Syndetin, C-terminal
VPTGEEASHSPEKKTRENEPGERERERGGRTLADFAKDRFEFVDTLIKAFYLPHEEVIVWCRKHPEYSLAQWHSIVLQGCGVQLKKRDRTGLLTVLDELYKQVEAQRLHQQKIEESRARELEEQSKVEGEAREAAGEEDQKSSAEGRGDAPSEETSGEAELSQSKEEADNDPREESGATRVGQQEATKEEQPSVETEKAAEAESSPLDAGNEEESPRESLA